MKPWPEDNTETVPFEDLVAPLAKFLRANYKRRSSRVARPRDLYDALHDIGHYEKACCPPPDEDLNEEGLAYHRGQGRDLIDVVLGICLRYGIEQGRRMTTKDLEFWKRTAEAAFPQIRRKPTDEKIKIDLSDPETRATWEAVLEAKEEVASWPAWKRGEK